MPGSQDPVGETWYFPGKFSFGWGTVGNVQGSVGNKGQLGTLDTTDRQSPEPLDYYLGENGNPSGLNVAQDFLGHMRIVTSGLTTIYQLTPSLIAYGGSNAHGEIAAGTTDSSAHTIGLITLSALGIPLGSYTWTDFSAGGDVTTGGQGGTMFGLTTQPAMSPPQRLYGWGHNANGQLGLGDTTQRTSPTEVASGVAKVHAGGKHALYLTTDGRVFSAGNNDFGQLGRGTIGVASTTWGEVAPPSGQTWIRIAAGYRASLFQASDGTIYGAGDGARNQLGATVTAMVNSQTATPTAMSGTMPTDIVEFMQAGTVSWFRTQGGDLWFHGNVRGGGLTGGFQSIVTVVGTTLTTSTASTTEPLRVPLDLSFPTNSTYTLNNPETVKCTQLAYISGNVDPYNLFQSPGSITPLAFPFMAVVDTNGLLRTFGGNAWAQHGTGSTSNPTDNSAAFVQRTILGGIKLCTVGLGSIFAVADGTLSRYDLPTWSGGDIKSLQVDGTIVTEPANWWLSAFDDSAWPAPTFLTDITLNASPAHFERITMEPYWGTDPDPGHTKLLTRYRITPPAETAHNVLPGKMSRISGDAAAIAVGPAARAAASHDTFSPFLDTGYSSFWINGTSTTLLDFFAALINPGVVNTFAARGTYGPSSDFTNATPARRYVALQPYVAYISAVVHEAVPAPLSVARSRVWVAVLG
jgi:hypothetical protein